ncbi:hypothetical protein BC827DRAFT_1273072 [Russula dissimulans]|nr:hypothetical protein BC827DRAFT_1273072 [Russula dissimulans]
MAAACVHCYGCKRDFTPRGLSQHLTRAKGTSLTFEENPPRYWEDDVSGDLGQRFPSISGAISGDNVDDSAVTTDSTITADGAITADVTDAIDTADADAFEFLNQGPIISTPFIPEGTEPVESLELVHPPEEQVDLMEAVDSEPTAGLVIERFPLGKPGAPMDGTHQAPSMYETHQSMFGDSVWAPFHSECDWEVVSWAKMEGPSSSAVTKLFGIPGVVEALGLSYRTVDELNAIIDKTLPGYPSFKSLAIKIGGEELQFHYRDILPLIQALYGNPEFACDLIFAPERHYLDSEKTHRVYSEMHTGDWWWSVQTSLELQWPGATIIPLVVSSDKTQLTLFWNKMAYPVYLTIGNVPKDICRKPSPGPKY